MFCWDHWYVCIVGLADDNCVPTNRIDARDADKALATEQRW